MSPKKSAPVPRSRLSLASRVLGRAVRGTVAASPPEEPWRKAKAAGKNQARR